VSQNGHPFFLFDSIPKGSAPTKEGQSRLPLKQKVGCASSLLLFTNIDDMLAWRRNE